MDTQAVTAANVGADNPLLDAHLDRPVPYATAMSTAEWKAERAKLFESGHVEGPHGCPSISMSAEFLALLNGEAGKAALQAFIDQARQVSAANRRRVTPEGSLSYVTVVAESQLTAFSVGGQDDPECTEVFLPAFETRIGWTVTENGDLYKPFVYSVIPGTDFDLDAAEAISSPGHVSLGLCVARHPETNPTGIQEITHIKDTTVVRRVQADSKDTVPIEISVAYTTGSKEGQPIMHHGAFAHALAMAQGAVGLSGAPRTAVKCLKDAGIRILDALGGQMPPDEPGAVPYRTTVDEVLIRIDAVGPTSSLREMRVVTALLRARDEQVERAGGDATKMERIYEAFYHAKTNWREENVVAEFTRVCSESMANLEDDEDDADEGEQGDYHQDGSITTSGLAKARGYVIWKGKVSITMDESIRRMKKAVHDHPLREEIITHIEHVFLSAATRTAKRQTFTQIKYVKETIATVAQAYKQFTSDQDKAEKMGREFSLYGSDSLVLPSKARIQATRFCDPEPLSPINNTMCAHLLNMNRGDLLQALPIRGSQQGSTDSVANVLQKLLDGIEGVRNAVEDLRENMDTRLRALKAAVAPSTATNPSRLLTQPRSGTPATPIPAPRGGRAGRQGPPAKRGSSNAPSSSGTHPKRPKTD